MVTSCRDTLALLKSCVNFGKGFKSRTWRKVAKVCKQLQSLYNSKTCKNQHRDTTTGTFYDPCNGPEDLLEVDQLGELPGSNG